MIVKVNVYGYISLTTTTTTTTTTILTLNIPFIPTDNSEWVWSCCSFTNPHSSSL